jgi:ribosomal protein S18 acetylase RimI-like enzyme
MSTVQVVEIDATGPELSAAAALFDRYRSFYGRPSNPSLAEHYLRERLAAGDSTVLLARHRDQWVGFCQLYRGFSSISCARTVILNDLYVDDGHRSAGVGRALIDHSSAFARRKCAAQVVLETAETNVRAQALYESLGFERSRGFVGYSLRLCPV